MPLVKKGVVVALFVEKVSRSVVGGCEKDSGE